ncbi:MAG TPA: hypothetical protein VN325_33475 [Steroidobacteraceae bacterium]|nr:hypothetical protein [Steroidobacteraceae bacterium]
MTDTTALRMNGYLVDPTSPLIVCRREGARWAQERTGYIRIDIDRDTKIAREIVEKLLEVVDSPRALLGRTSQGSAVMLFRAGEKPVSPDMQGTHSRGHFELALGSGEKITIDIDSVGAVIVPNYSWGKRSPESVPRHELPELTSDVGDAVITEAFKLGCTWAPTAEEIAAEAARQERYKQIAADIASGKLIPNPTPEQQLEIDDNKLVAAHEGAEFHEYDGNFANLVISARRRVARRKAQAVAA